MPANWRAAMEQANSAVNAAFGEPAIYTPVSGETPYPVSGVFDEAFLELVVVDGTQVQTVQPTLGLQLSQLRADPVQDDQLTIVRTGESYVVREPRPDGHGWCRLMLNYIGDENG